MGLAHASICSVKISNPKPKRHRKPKIGVNVSWGRSNQFWLQRSVGRPHNVSALCQRFSSLIGVESGPISALVT